MVDYRALNSVTKSDGFPLPQVMDILNRLVGGKSFAKLDLANGYWQVPVREEDREKTAVVTHCGLFEFISMPFGLKTAGATFQRLMQATFSDFLMGNVTGSSDNQTGFCMPYVDDLIVRSMSDYGALEHYEQIFKRAAQVGMQFKPSKCTFFSTHLEVLGHIVTPNGRIPDPKKVLAISDFPDCCSEVPRNGTYTPMRTSLVLALYLFKRITSITCSPFSMQAKRFHPPTKDGWDTREQELYAVKWAVEQWHPYLLGRKFVVETDHDNLKRLCSVNPHKAKLERLESSLAEYNFELRHHPGRSNAVPDALSRYPVTQFIPSENNVSSATFVDILPLVDVSAYLVTALGLTPYYFVPLTPTISSSFKTALALTTADTSTFTPTKAEHLSTTTQTEEPLTLLGSNRQELITLQLQDQILTLIHKYLSAGSK